MNQDPWQGRHRPVMADEVIEALAVRSGGRYVDATVGDGGHTERLLTASDPDGAVLGIDRDRAAIARARRRLQAFEGRLTLVHGDFDGLAGRMAELGWSDGADGVLLDLGVSTLQLLSPERGFSFAADGPLDMRMNPDRGETAAQLLNRLSEKEIADLLFRYGEERASRRIARAIVARRPLERSAQLREAVLSAGVRGRPGHDPATRSFQALRIAVNDELGQLERFLDDAWRLLRPRGRMAILSYHSLEDRLVKRRFAHWAADCLCPPEQPVCNCGKQATVRLLTRRKRRPGERELRENPRARSAGLRVVERLPDREAA